MRTRSSSSQVNGTAPTENVSSILETIAAGISLVVSRPYLLVVPVLVDLYLWLGSRISIQPLTSAFTGYLDDNRGLIAQSDDEIDASIANLQQVGEMTVLNDVVSLLIPSVFSGIPRDTFLNALFTVFAAPITVGIDRDDMYNNWGTSLGGVLEPANGFSVIGLGLLFLMMASLICVLFRVPAVLAVRNDGFSPGRVVKELAVGWIRLVLWFAVLFSLALLLLGGVVIAGLLLGAIGIIGPTFIALGIFFFGGLIALFTLFVIDAMLLYQVGPITGLSMSYTVVRSYFAQTMRFAGALLLLATGALQVWSLAVSSPPGIAVAFIANAFLGASLMAASLYYFFDRSQALARQEQRQLAPEAAHTAS